MSGFSQGLAQFEPLDFVAVTLQRYEWQHARTDLFESGASEKDQGKAYGFWEAAFWVEDSWKHSTSAPPTYPPETTRKEAVAVRQRVRARATTPRTTLSRTEAEAQVGARTAAAALPGTATRDWSRIDYAGKGEFPVEVEEEARPRRRLFPYESQAASGVVSPELRRTPTTRSIPLGLPTAGLPAETAKEVSNVSFNLDSVLDLAGGLMGGIEKVAGVAGEVGGAVGKVASAYSAVTSAFAGPQDISMPIMVAPQPAAAAPVYAPRIAAEPRPIYTPVAPTSTYGSPSAPLTAMPRNGGVMPAAIGIPGYDLVKEASAGAMGRLMSPFVPTVAGARAQAFIATNPVTGAPTWFRPAGRPILFSGDLPLCKRVKKVGRKARSATGGR